jgi:hypothetical protein
LQDLQIISFPAHNSIRNRLEGRIHSIILHLKITAMKKILLALACFAWVSSFAQKNKWSISVSASPGIGGPKNSIVTTMKKQGFDETMSFNFFGLTGVVTNPNSEKAGTYLLRVSVRQKINRSLFFVGGLSNQGTVSGFRSTSGDSLFPWTLSFPIVDYRVWQLSGGYQFDQKNSWLKFAIAPSLFFYNYGLKFRESDRKTSLVPGINLSGRLPLGKGKRTFGVELFADGNIALKAKMKDLQETIHSAPLKESKVNMMHATAGLLFTFRG